MGRDVTESERRELAEILKEMGYDPASKTWMMDRLSRPSAWIRIVDNILIAAASIGVACLTTMAITGPPHLPISMVPFYLGVAAAARLRGRLAGCSALALTLPAFYFNARVAELPWLVLSLMTLAVIATMGGRDGLDRVPRRQPRSRIPSQALLSSHPAAPPATPYRPTLHV